MISAGDISRTLGNGFAPPVSGAIQLTVSNASDAARGGNHVPFGQLGPGRDASDRSRWRVGHPASRPQQPPASPPARSGPTTFDKSPIDFSFSRVLNTRSGRDKFSIYENTRRLSHGVREGKLRPRKARLDDGALGVTDCEINSPQPNARGSFMDAAGLNKGGNKADNLGLPKASAPAKCASFPAIGSCE